MPPHLTDEQKNLESTLRRFARNELLPGAAERDQSGKYPARLVERLVQLDLMGITVDPRWGGLGAETSMLLVTVEQIAYGDAALASILTGHYLGMEVLNLAADTGLRERFLTLLASGRQLCAFALTEPDAGSDVGALRTEARPRGSGWILNGTKTFISNAREAGVVIVFAKTDPERGLDGISAFAVPGNTKGLSFSGGQAKLGIRSAPTYEVNLEDVPADGEQLIGGLGDGGSLALEALNRARIDIAAMANGITMRALELACEYAAKRRQFGRPLQDFQAIQLQLAEIDVALEIGRLCAFNAAEIKDSGGDVRRAGAISKLVSSEGCWRAVDTALQIFGGYGYMQESEIERLLRDSRILRIFEGTSQMQLLTIARALRQEAQ